MAETETPTRRYFDVRAAADYCGLSVGTLNRLRTRGDGPPFIAVLARRVYAVDDLERWLLSRRVTSTAAVNPKHRRPGNGGRRDRGRAA